MGWDVLYKRRARGTFGCAGTRHSRWGAARASRPAAPAILPAADNEKTDSVVAMVVGTPGRGVQGRIRGHVDYGAGATSMPPNLTYAELISPRTGAAPSWT